MFILRCECVRRGRSAGDKQVYREDRPFDFQLSIA